MAAVVAIHLGLLFVMLHLSPSRDLPGVDSAIRVFNLSQPPPPETPSPHQQQKQQPKPKQKEGGAAPPNIRSQATPVKAPKPVIPQVPETVASETPRQGTQATQGAAPIAGPGTGAGGIGTGTGSGAGGNGPGGGGDNGVAEPPHLTTPVLSGRDFPGYMLERWPRGMTIFMRLRVDARGFVSECTVDRGTGVASIDSAVCNLVHERLRFRPAFNRSGQAVAGWFGYAQRAPR